MEQQYKGLSNIGATCYMNSLLQTLYMTPQFKQAVYQWKYNERIHPKPEDSILYQLQRLFGKLDSKFPGEISTRDLVKSFQWKDQEAQMQQDIQQFNRVLFEALQKSLRTKKQAQKSESFFLRDLFQGEMIHYTHCRECENESQKQQIFQDLLLAVKNPYEKIYNNCIQLGIQRYMKPEILDQDNLYKCEVCKKLVPAERGVRFLKMPKLLNIVLRRFDLDYFTFTRIKINDRVQFPHILNINNYMQGYSNIQNKLNEENSAYFQNKQLPKKNNFGSHGQNTIVQKKTVVKKTGAPNVAGKITTKPSANTKSFLAQMRKKKFGSQSQQANEDLLFVSGNAQIHKKQDQNKNLDQQVKSAGLKINDKKIQEIKQPLSAQLNQRQSSKGQNKNQVQEANELPPLPSLPPPPPPFLLSLLQPPQISKPYKNLQHVTISQQEQLNIVHKQRQRLSLQKDNKLQQYEKKNSQKIEQYLKEGNLVYELYSILVHNGTATHGHYYSYIKSFENGHWYSFNDDRVNQINIEEIQKTYGGVGHSSAYALYYRQVSQMKEETSRKISIPNYISNKIQQQIANLKRKEKQKIENLENVFILKIYYQLSVKLLQINKSSTLELCLVKSREMFNIPESILPANSRLRMFNPVSDSKLQTFEGKQNLTLEELKISSYKSLLLEIKKDSQTFEQYVVGKMSLRIALWQQCKNSIKSLDQQFLKLHKISVNKGASMKQVERVIQQKRRQLFSIDKESSVDNICIVKRHQNDEYSYHEIINLFDYKQKNVDQLMVLENQILFVEPDSNKLMWPQQFQNQIYRITIKYLHGDSGKSDNYLTDSRKSIGDLKLELTSILGIQGAQTIIKRGTKSGMELKNLSSSMKDARFISGTHVYLQKGIPAKPGQIRIQLFTAKNASQQAYNRLHEFQFVADVPINGHLKAGQVKQIFSNVLKKYQNIEKKASQFRIRQKVCEKIGKIYRQRPMKQQQLIEKREIAIEFEEANIDEKDFLTYVRIWDPENWNLSKRYDIIVSKTTTMKELSQLIYAQNQSIQIQDMQICRILSINKFKILDLCEMEYFQMTEANVVAEPLFVNADGLLFVVKSVLKQPRSLTKQQQLKFGGSIKQYTRTLRGKQNSKGPKQKGVSIKVIQNKEQEEIGQ